MQEFNIELKKFCFYKIEEKYLVLKPNNPFF